MAIITLSDNKNVIVRDINASLDVVRNYCGDELTNDLEKRILEIKDNNEEKESLEKTIENLTIEIFSLEENSYSLEGVLEEVKNRVAALPTENNFLEEIRSIVNYINMAL